MGYDFALEVYSTIEQIVACPKAWVILEEEVRRCLTRRFPYGVLYTEVKTEASAKGKDVEGLRTPQAVACTKRCIQELGVFTYLGDPS